MAVGTQMGVQDCILILMMMDSRLSACLQDEYWSEEAIVDHVMKDMEQAMDICSMSSVRGKMRVVKPYDGMPNKSLQDVRPKSLA